MNEKEKKEFYIAMCRCCLIAQAMKTCSFCNFSIGLVEKMKPVESSPAAKSEVVSAVQTA
jgi:hypothetical protein